MKLNRRNFISASAGIAATISSPMVFGASRPKGCDRWWSWWSNSSKIYRQRFKRCY